MSTTWDSDLSGPDYWDWFRKYFEEMQRSFNIDGEYDPTYGNDSVEATATCKECHALVPSNNMEHLNGHRAWHDTLSVTLQIAARMAHIHGKGE